ncbi:response regulator [Belnapia sp. T6]|uniref:Response regulator n=1 Tax=Belnapia mucosa TaxID=2804532 RepID=A0ABS1V9J1_9PROT|nr:response regulator [Belnapia mucosa]MBL6458307.1 response regulator [Belnapia mucosa]
MIALLVEDEALISLALQDLLEAEGFETVVAYTEAEATQAVPDGLTVAIVNLALDVELGGKRVIRHLRERIPHLPVVVVTGYDSTTPEADLRGLGGPTVRFLKPADFGGLAAALRGVIEAGKSPPGPHPRRRRTDQA